MYVLSSKRNSSVGEKHAKIITLVIVFPGGLFLLHPRVLLLTAAAAAATYSGDTAADDLLVLLLHLVHGRGGGGRGLVVLLLVVLRVDRRHVVGTTHLHVVHHVIGHGGRLIVGRVVVHLRPGRGHGGHPKPVAVLQTGRGRGGRRVLHGHRCVHIVFAVDAAPAIVVVVVVVGCRGRVQGVGQHLRAAERAQHELLLFARSQVGLGVFQHHTDTVVGVPTRTGTFGEAAYYNIVAVNDNNGTDEFYFDSVNSFRGGLGGNSRGKKKKKHCESRTRTRRGGPRTRVQRGLKLKESTTITIRTTATTAFGRR